MLTTKAKGRVMFPHLKYVVSGLDPDEYYVMHLGLERVDNIKYTFTSGKWTEGSAGEPIHPFTWHEHKDGARLGSHWMGQTVSFATHKITNDPSSRDASLIRVHSLHKYQPVLRIARVHDPIGEEFRLKITEFMVVTQYNSSKVADLKKEYNKYAKGRRDSNGVASKRGHISLDSSSSGSSSTTVSPVRTAWDPMWYRGYGGEWNYNYEMVWQAYQQNPHAFNFHNFSI
ncbi:unnamed protein product [Caenorhabditis sp. 36 PRJEB53466]|nr:unnamed protein product [Caenorhabditis sp. 36 PRJEB53466]